MTIILLSIPCWLIPLLVGLICAFLGYLLGKLLSSKNTTTIDVDVYKNRISKLETDLAACKSSKSNVSHTSGAANTIASSLTATNTIKGVAFNPEEAKAVFGKKITENDLTVVEGIGPKIKELFHNHDVTTWADLANCTVEKCKDVLKSGGKRFEMHKPGTWPKQAEYAAKGQWKALKEWQSQLNGGK
ncbi:hypothetical protein C7H62_1201 [Mesoflavibacter sp. HG96]|uniref:LSU ribosomal protein L21p n=1 Tax=Mesoflavibacter profundi TaxID=2708110 RepID=A0ABT4S1V0_9FLAO|nr:MULTISPECIES: hypothetical protein [Mesoflavibacter]MDA0178049.1 hypothetical protein [Mesoflavibacter profundi]QIJ89010.1 hypothetical protein C7H62_1201 [Mesoflavibacter sp. HG96]QIJ91738.1 hypothetical protein C7H56_1201 [Mesoflavibacter sp. HG37]